MALFCWFVSCCVLAMQSCLCWESCPWFVLVMQSLCSEIGVVLILCECSCTCYVLVLWSFSCICTVLIHEKIDIIAPICNTCNVKDNIFHCFCHNFCSEMSSLITNTSKQSYFSNVSQNQKKLTLFLSLHRVLSHDVFK